MIILFLTEKKNKFVNNVKESKMGNIKDAIEDMNKIKKQIDMEDYHDKMSRVWLRSTEKRRKHKLKDEKLNVKKKQKDN